MSAVRAEGGEVWRSLLFLLSFSLDLRFLDAGLIGFGGSDGPPVRVTVWPHAHVKGAEWTVDELSTDMGRHDSQARSRYVSEMLMPGAMSREKYSILLPGHALGSTHASAVKLGSVGRQHVCCTTQLGLRAG